MADEQQREREAVAAADERRAQGLMRGEGKGELQSEAMGPQATPPNNQCARDSHSLSGAVHLEQDISHRDAAVHEHVLDTAEDARGGLCGVRAEVLGALGLEVVGEKAPRVLLLVGKILVPCDGLDQRADIGHPRRVPVCIHVLRSSGKGECKRGVLRVRVGFVCGSRGSGYVMRKSTRAKSSR